MAKKAIHASHDKNKLWKYRWLPAEVLLGAAALAVLMLVSQITVTTIVDSKNGEFTIARYRFIEEDFNNPRLQLLRKRENLDRIIAPGRNQFEKILLLRKWAHGQWKAGSKFFYPPWDAVEILDLARKYKNNGFCAQYAIVFVQACQSVGIHARYVELAGHFIAAVWSDDYDRWVVMDPTYDLHYEKDGIPLKGRELCDAYWRGRVKGIYRVSSDGTRTPVLKKGDIDNYKIYEIVLKANQLSEPVEANWNGVQTRIMRGPDYKNYPLVTADSVGIVLDFLEWKEDDADQSLGGRTESDDPDDFRYAQNQTIMFFANGRKNMAKIKLFYENSPTFRTYLVSFDGVNWQETNSDIILWTLKPGLNKLSARVLTKFGWLGNESFIEIFYKPRWITLPDYRHLFSKN